MRTIDKIITQINCKYGSPMGRDNIGNYPANLKKHSEYKKVFDCSVPMSNNGTYDKGGAYWGLGK